MALCLAGEVWTFLRYILYPVHVNDLQRRDWAEQRNSVLESAVDVYKRPPFSKLSKCLTYSSLALFVAFHQDLCDRELLLDEARCVGTRCLYGWFITRFGPGLSCSFASLLLPTCHEPSL